MFVLGLQGSPRIKGNTDILLSSFLDEAKSLGAKTYKLKVAKKNLTPCQGCGTCEREGFCPIDDEMQEVYPLIRRSDIIALATPVFFYGVTAQLKALIDRSQALWSRKYVHKLTDPAHKRRQGFFLSIGATKGKNLFEGVSLTAKYFFDAVSATECASLTYKKIEKAGEIKNHPTALKDAKEKAKILIKPFLSRKKILFICRENACRSQMAGAFAQYYAGDKIEVENAGSNPASEINNLMTEVMEEKGIDMAYQRPKSIENALSNMKPDVIISMGCKDECPYVPSASREDWDLPDPSGKPISFMRKVRDEIEKRVVKLIDIL
jgi:multimeric flavodoxin WrbA